MPHSLSGLTIGKIARIRRFSVQALDDAAGTGGRITIYEPPRPKRLYCAGADFALGLQDGDRDVCAIYDRSSMNEGDGVAPQVAEAEGQWGEEFDVVLMALLRYFGGAYPNAFLVGERQVGLPTMRRLYRAGLRFMYYQRHEDRKTRKRTDLIGVHKNQKILLVRALRKAIKNRLIEPRSVRAIEEMGRLQFKDLPTAEESGERSPDEDLRVKLDKGSPDAVMGHVYAWHALGEVDHFEPEDKKWPAGSFGAVLGEDDDLLDDSTTDGVRLAGRRR